MSTEILLLLFSSLLCLSDLLFVVVFFLVSICEKLKLIDHEEFV